MKATVLVVDDEPRTLEPLRKILERNGYKVETASDKSEAEEKAKDILPDLVLLDIMMPPNWQEEGIEVCHNLKNNDETRNIPIIMLTVRGEEEIKQKCFDAGADGFINKPFSRRELLGKIEKVLPKHGETNPSENPIAKFFAELKSPILKLSEAY